MSIVYAEKIKAYKEHFNIKEGQKVVIGVGLLFKRKGMFLSQAERSLKKLDLLDEQLLEVEKLLDSVNITCNKNTIPNDPQSPFVTSGVRLGTPAVTSRGMNTEDMDRIAEAIAMVIKGGEEKVPEARAIVQSLTDKYPLI